MKFTVRLTLLAALALVSVPSGAESGDRGMELATTGAGTGIVPCVACHGADGLGNSAAAFPSLAGLDQDYITRQLRLIRDGGRAVPVMAPGLSSLTDGDAEALGRYYASLTPPPAADAALSDEEAATGEALARVGDWPGRELPACLQCHGPDGGGVGEAFPALAGQHASYLAAQLTAWKEGARGTDPNDLMGTIARKLTETEIQAVSKWLAATPRRSER